ncbi:MAG: Mrp/NBP35 family ATP-binding protein [Clostridia bacterium]|nr:Mrp/NBP35 family ATP-binding protein [Clostridia bacterium]
MSENCSHDCSSCSKNCSDRSEIFKEKQNEGSKIKKIIGVISGKGGVGKSFVASSLAVLLNRRGYKTAIIDGDITGPSIPKEFGVTEKAGSYDGKFLVPVKTESGIKIMSVNLLLENENDPVVWRGPVIAGAVKQFYTDVLWGDVDYMFVDMPPGTGDVPLTVFQSLPVDGIIVVTSPQDLVSMIVGKSVKMAELMKIKLLGIVENYSYMKCPDCGKIIEVYGESKVIKTAEEFKIDTAVKLPIDPAFSKLSDSGNMEKLDFEYLDPIVEKIIKNCPVK